MFLFIFCIPKGKQNGDPTHKAGTSEEEKKKKA